MFAYLGPPDKRPVLPAYDNLETVAPGETLWRSYGGFGATGDDSMPVVPYSWLHMNDNVMDPFTFRCCTPLSAPCSYVPQFAVMPKVDFFETEGGVCYSAVRELPDGRQVDRISSWLLPNIMSVPDVTLKAGPSTGISWVVPVDDSHYIQAMVGQGFQGRALSQHAVQRQVLGQMTEAEHRNTPGDFEAQAGQAPSPCTPMSIWSVPIGVS